MVDLADWQHLLQGDTVRLDDPILVYYFVSPCHWVPLRLLALFCLLAVRDLRDLWEALQGQLVEQLVLSLFEHHGHCFFVILVGSKVWQSQSEDQLREVFQVPMPHDVDLIVSQLRVKHVFDLFYVEVTSDHLLSIELKPEKPGTHTAGVSLGEVCAIVEGEQLLVSLDDGFSGIWVVVDCRTGDYVAQGRVLDRIAYLTGSRFVLAMFVLQEDPDGWRLDRLRHVDDFLEPRYTQRHIPCGHSCQMEGVEGHLCGRLTHALCTDAPRHFSRVSQAALKPGLNRSKQPVEGFLGEPLSLDNMLGRENRPQINLE